LSDLFRILFRPSSTLDRLLETRRYGASRGKTAWLFVLSLVVSFLSGVFFYHRLQDYALAQGWYDFMTTPEEYDAYAVLFGLSTFGLAAYVLLSRPLFARMVQLGLRLSASSQVPSKWSERREQGRLLRLVQPYTIWPVVLPALISYLLMPLAVDPHLLLGSADDVYSNEGSGALVVPLARFLFWVFFSSLLLLTGFVYMVIVRVLAIRKICHVSGARAFWGPFLIYAIVWFVMFAAWAAWVIYMYNIDPVNPVGDPILWL
jgi:hypothetical protein